MPDKSKTIFYLVDKTLLWEQLLLFNDLGNFSAWLHRIVRLLDEFCIESGSFELNWALWQIRN